MTSKYSFKRGYMGSAGKGQWKKYIFGHRRESFRHLSNDNKEADADSIFVKAFLVMEVVEIICVYNSCFWKLMTLISVYNDNCGSESDFGGIEIL